MKRNRRNLSPEDKKKKELVRELLKLNPIKDGNDLNSLIKEMIGEVLEGALEGELEDKIISMYAKGMTTSDIEDHISDLYDLEVFDSTVSRITDKILPIAREWQNRPLESICAVVFIDAIHYHVRSEGQITKKAVYIALGINLDGIKEVLGMWVGETESAKFWLTKMNELKNRGVEDILIAFVDGLTGFSSAIASAFPKAEIQQCIIHQIRNTTRYVSYKDIKSLMVD